MGMSARPVQNREFAGASVWIYQDAETTAQAAADHLAEVVKRGRAVIGLATGGTPKPVYERLVTMHRAGELSFEKVITYNLDEYYPIQPTDPNSYRAYMDRHLFRHVNLAANQTHLLDGTVPQRAIARHAAEFERWIEADGGLDLQILGVGRNGHIGFNEPSDLSVAEALRLPTRLVNLHPVTRADAAGDFGGVARVIDRAFTMGVATILSARSILVMAVGTHKAEPVAKALQGPITARLPASLLQTVGDRVTWMIDEAAAAGLD